MYWRIKRMSLFYDGASHFHFPFKCVPIEAVLNIRHTYIAIVFLLLVLPCSLHNFQQNKFILAASLQAHTYIQIHPQQILLTHLPISLPHLRVTHTHTRIHLQWIFSVMFPLMTCNWKEKQQHPKPLYIL